MTELVRLRSTTASQQMRWSTMRCELLLQQLKCRYGSELELGESRETLRSKAGSGGSSVSESAIAC